MDKDFLRDVFYVTSRGEACAFLPARQSLAPYGYDRYVLKMFDNSNNSPLWRNRIIRHFLAAKAEDIALMEDSMRSHGSILMGPMDWETAVIKRAEIRQDARRHNYDYTMEVSFL